MVGLQLIAEVEIGVGFLEAPHFVERDAAFASRLPIAGIELERALKFSKPSGGGLMSAVFRSAIRASNALRTRSSTSP